MNRSFLIFALQNNRVSGTAQLYPHSALLSTLDKEHWFSSHGLGYFVLYLLTMAKNSSACGLFELQLPFAATFLEPNLLTQTWHTRSFSTPHLLSKVTDKYRDNTTREVFFNLGLGHEFLANLIYLD